METLYKMAAIILTPIFRCGSLRRRHPSRLRHQCPHRSRSEGHTEPRTARSYVADEPKCPGACESCYETILGFVHNGRHEAGPSTDQKGMRFRLKGSGTYISGIHGSILSLHPSNCNVYMSPSGPSRPMNTATLIASSSFWADKLTSTVSPDLIRIVVRVDGYCGLAGRHNWQRGGRCFGVRWPGAALAGRGLTRHRPYID